MKTTTTIVLITLLSIAVIFTACTTNTHTTTDVVGLWDITDAGIPRPDANEIVKLYGFDKDKWNGGSFKLSAITEVSLNTSEQSNVQYANQLLSNDFKRDDEIKLFKKGVADIIAKAEQTKTGQNNSSIYIPIAKELNQLAQNKADRKILLVYSDLMENTYSLSFYKQKDLSMLIKEPEALTEQLEKMQALDDLSGIEVYFIYQPPNSKSGALFQLVSSGFYKKLLEKKGAKVFITANLNF